MKFSVLSKPHDGLSGELKCSVRNRIRCRYPHPHGKESEHVTSTP